MYNNYIELIKYFDFTKKPNFEELEENTKLLEYINSLESRIRDLEYAIRQDHKPFLSEKMNNIWQYIMFCEYNNRIKIIEEQKQELKVLKDRETELNEYLEEIVKKMRNDLKL